jgi:hypothetical protein
MPIVVVRTTAQVTRLIRPTLLSVFLDTRHCRRMSIGKSGTGNTRSRPYDVQFHARTRTLTTPSVNAARPGGSRRKRKAGKEERLQDSSNGSLPSVVFNSQPQRKPSSKKQFLGGKSTLVKESKLPLQVPNSSGPANQVKGDKILSSQTTGSHTPQNSGANPTSIDKQPPNHKRDSYHEEAEKVEVIKQTPNPTGAKTRFNPHPSAEGISGKAAAIAYLRIRGIANRGPKKTFYAVLAWVLRHAARSLGFDIVPDGFVRISDLVRFFLSHSPSLVRKKADYFHVFFSCNLSFSRRTHWKHLPGRVLTIYLIALKLVVYQTL